MAHIESHAPGAFSWIELATSDQVAAKHFYTTLFGWTSDDSPVGPNDYYTMFQLDGRNAGAAYTIRQDEVEMGVPPHWNLYITVSSADETSAKAEGLGGKNLYGPFDVMGHGRMAVIQDPTGTVFCIWEPKSHIGISVAGEANSFCRADLSTPDPAFAGPFYTGLFGYHLTTDPGGYSHIENSQANCKVMIGGIQPTTHREPHTPPHWLVYLQVDDCDAKTAQAQSLGAKVYMGPMTMENVGRMTVLADPQGAVFALFQPA